MLDLNIDMRDGIEQLAGLARQLQRQKPAVLGAIGRELVAAAHQDFVVKALGGTGADGTRWPDLTPAVAHRKGKRGRTAIGVDRGELGNINNLRALVGPAANAFGQFIAANEVVVDFVDQPKANYFAGHAGFRRPLMPDRLPDPWYRIAMTTAADLLRRVS